MHRSSLNIARLIYLLICQAAGVAIALSTRGTGMEISVAVGISIGLIVGLFFIGIERLIKGFTLRGFSTATFGLGVGLFCAWLLTRVEISNLLEIALRDELEESDSGEVLVTSLRLALDVTLYASLAFLGSVLALRTNRDEFAFIIPYVRFRQDASTGQAIVIDADSIMDGRVIGLYSSGFLSGRLIVTQFVLDEIQAAAADGATGLRQRGQRGLTNLEKMQSAIDIQVSIHDAKLEGETQNNQARLIEVAKFYSARLLTTDDGLAKSAKLQNISALNLNELDAVLRPGVEVGDVINLLLVRSGKEDHQAVGYLPSGAMVVVNQAVQDIGKSIDVIVITTIHSSTGNLIFAERK